MDISLAEGIKFGKEDLCKDVGDQIDDLQRGMNRTVNLGRSYGASSVLSGITAIDESPTFVATENIDSELANMSDNVSNKMDGIQSFKDGLASGELIEGSNISAKTITDCLAGIDLSKFGNPDGTIPMGSAGKVLEEATNWLSNNMLDMLDTLIDPLEKTLANAIDGLRNLLDIPALDKLLQLLDCLQDCPGANFGGVATDLKQWRIYCLTEQKEYTIYSETLPGTYACPIDENHVCDEELHTMVRSGISSPVAIEEKLTSVGLTLNGEIDWNSPVFSEAPIPNSVKENMEKITTFKKDAEDQITALKEFSPVPEIPELPTIPKFDNPINKLPAAEKIMKLF